jgi:hypothetical protein
LRPGVKTLRGKQAAAVAHAASMDALAGRYLGGSFGGFHPFTMPARCPKSKDGRCVANITLINKCLYF